MMDAKKKSIIIGYCAAMIVAAIYVPWKIDVHLSRASTSLYRGYSFFFRRPVPAATIDYGKVALEFVFISALAGMLWVLTSGVATRSEGNRSSAPSIEDIIRILIRRRFLETGIPDEITRTVDSLDRVHLYSTPEAAIAVIVETYAMLKKQGIEDGEIFSRIEAHRAALGTGEIPQPPTLENYVAYRIALEHGSDAPVSPDFIAEAVAVCRTLFDCPHGPEAGDKADNEQGTQPVESGSAPDAKGFHQNAADWIVGTEPGSSLDAAMQFMAAMPHPEADVPVRKLRFESENVDIAYYENPKTIGAVEIGIGQPYETPQVAVIIEDGNPVLIVRTEKTGMGDLALCTLDPSGVHGNYGPFEPTRAGPLDEEFISRAIEVFQSIKRR